MRPTTHQNCTLSCPGTRGSATFMPHMPVSTVSGMKIVEMTVSTFITVVQLVRHVGQVRVEEARDAVLEEHRFVREPDQVIVHVAEPVRHLFRDDPNSRRARRPTASRCGSTTRRSEATSRLKSRMRLRKACGRDARRPRSRACPGAPAACRPPAGSCRPSCRRCGAAERRGLRRARGRSARTSRRSCRSSGSARDGR